MYFKRLELIGFKSFRDRTILEFEPGVTAIVGPNGCGKSNVSDAIRWVLGEQSARDLRGNRMEDVIFNGTQRDDPLGLAEVSLTLSNEKRFLPIEYDEVTITRRLFRSGESEYLINHVPVRLRDIAALVMGTGLGQISYAHMAQGKIDEILSAHPEERRLIFEEASGITKYRSQKKEALRKLEQTETNLLRVKDILIELGRQIRSLERQAEKAKRYKEDFETLKGLELGAARHEHALFTEKLHTISDERRSLKGKEESLLKEREALTEKVRHLRVHLETVETNLGMLQAKKVDLSSRIRQGEDRMALYQERIGELNQERERSLREKQQLEEDLTQFEAHVGASERAFQRSLEEIASKESALVSLEEALKETLQFLSTSEEGISRKKLEAVEVAQEKSKVKNDLTRIAAEDQSLSNRERRLVLEKEEAFRDEAQVRERREAIEKDVQKTREKITVQKEERESLEKEKEALSHTLQNYLVEIQTLRQTLTALSSRCDLLEEARKNDEGFSQGTKAVLKEMRQKNPEFLKCHGVVADLLEVTPGYERAIEELLGPMVQALVVGDDDAARQGIRYLENRGLGRASFVSLQSLSKFAKFQSGPGQSDQGGIQHSNKRSVRDVVRVSPDFEALMALFGDAAIAEEIEEILSQGGSGTVVTLKGELYRNGVFTGGSPLTEGMGLIGRETRILSLRSEIAQVESNLKGTLDQEASLKAAQKEKEALLEKAANVCHQLEVALSNQENLLESILGEEKRLKEEGSLVDLELEEVRGELEELKKKQEGLLEHLHHLEEKDHGIQEDLARLQSLVSQKNKEREETLVQIAEMKASLEAAFKRCEDQKKSHALLEATLKEKRGSIVSKENQAQSDLLRASALSEEMVKLEEEKRHLLTETEEVERIWGEKEKEKRTAKAEAASVQDQISLCDQNLGGLQTDFHDLEIEEQKLQYEIRAIEERLRLAYKVELTRVLEEIEPVALEGVRPDIERLREKLERMGPVNLVAIEEHEELKKRHEFLTTQKEDLEKSKESLLEAIQKINKVTRELFLTTFQQIQNNFHEYFRLLFGGGNARLILLDERDILESGIEIFACPPGKKLQDVSLLSGGERALTVIALLFAVFKEKPSPFCVLDEIDAPLDEPNIARFTSVLEEFLSASQFILVTHNKRTISMADVMYGITMEKTGVSKIVSVKFKED